MASFPTTAGRRDGLRLAVTLSVVSAPVLTCRLSLFIARAVLRELANRDGRRLAV